MPLARSSNVWRSGGPRRHEVRNRLKERAVFQNLKRGDATRCGFAEDTIPAGLAVVLPSGENRYQSLNLQVLNIPFITGVAVQINWRDIEPTQGAPDWSKLDELFAAAESAKIMGSARDLARLSLAGMGPRRHPDRKEFRRVEGLVMSRDGATPMDIGWTRERVRIDKGRN